MIHNLLKEIELLLFFAKIKELNLSKEEKQLLLDQMEALRVALSSATLEFGGKTYRKIIGFDSSSRCKDCSALWNNDLCQAVYDKATGGCGQNNIVRIEEVKS